MDQAENRSFLGELKDLWVDWGHWNRGEQSEQQKVRRRSESWKQAVKGVLTKHRRARIRYYENVFFAFDLLNQRNCVLLQRLWMDGWVKFPHGDSSKMDTNITEMGS